ncbi:hypothetical protein [Marimonas arenosa]|uniref:Uncharacterized protein n=1 Tax=Marimonas arenosa TaxID=1795305 RepID=A0AAE4B4L1_9RHOB|nr:hypothetical protein [Marimonas arenosa]MDQ2089494.1 hypothetical protein [Marimonas arenosa]
MMRRLLYILLSLATWGLFVVMALWSLPEIKTEADGKIPFDLRPFGYSAAEAEAFLNALSDEGRVFYAEIQHGFDALFPALLLVWAAWTVWALFRGPARWGVMALAVLGCVADYAENATVAQLLDGFQAQLAATASRWTMLKSATWTVVYLAILWGVFGLIRRRVFNRGAG